MTQPTCSGSGFYCGICRKGKEINRHRFNNLTECSLCGIAPFQAMPCPGCPACKPDATPDYQKLAEEVMKQVWPKAETTKEPFWQPFLAHFSEALKREYERGRKDGEQETADKIIKELLGR